jgi:hypothetical protein
VTTSGRTLANSPAPSDRPSCDSQLVRRRRQTNKPFTINY